MRLGHSIQEMRAIARGRGGTCLSGRVSVTGSDTLEKRQVAHWPSRFILLAALRPGKVRLPSGHRNSLDGCDFEFRSRCGCLRESWREGKKKTDDRDERAHCSQSSSPLGMIDDEHSVPIQKGRPLRLCLKSPASAHA